MTDIKLPTYRNETDNTGIPIAKVGIRQVRAPMVIHRKDGENERVVGKWSIYTDLTESFKGASMSLMQRMLFKSIEDKISTDVLIDITNQLVAEAEHKAHSAYVKVEFPYTIVTKSPKSGYESVKVYDCGIEVTNIKGEIKKYLNVKIQYIATCPCSLELARVLKEDEDKDSGGHQQRAFGEIKIQFENTVWIEDLIADVEAAIKAVPYPVIRKPDEQFICYTARQNPLFVEEASRTIALVLEKNEKILDYVVVCNHEESIHESNAVAVVRKGVSLT